MRLLTAALLLVICLPATLLLVGCKHETNPVSGAEIKLAEPDAYLAGLEEVLRHGKQIGYLKTYRFRDQPGREVVRVVDTQNRGVGIRDHEGIWWRFSAHDGRTLVGNADRRRINVAAVYGLPDHDVEIKLHEKL